MTRLPFAAAFAVALVAATPASAASQIQQLVAHELPSYGFAEVDASKLTSTQLHAIYGVMHRSLSQSEKRAHIRSILGGSYSLRGLLFRN